MRTLNEAFDRMKELMEEKGEAYGPTYRRTAAALGVAPQYSILVRIVEKAMRCDNILRHSDLADVSANPALVEEFLDIAVYAVLAAFESAAESAAEAETGTVEQWPQERIGKLM